MAAGLLERVIQTIRLINVIISKLVVLCCGLPPYFHNVGRTGHRQEWDHCTLRRRDTREKAGAETAESSQKGSPTQEKREESTFSTYLGKHQ